MKSYNISSFREIIYAETIVKTRKANQRFYLTNWLLTTFTAQLN